jgi:hypothetical protein
MFSTCCRVMAWGRAGGQGGEGGAGRAGGQWADLHPAEGIQAGTTLGEDRAALV